MDEEEDVATRTALVHAAQRRLHMEPRDDSALTRMFAAGELPPYMTAEVVARELMATDFVYKTTPYPELIEDYMRKVAELVRAEYGLTWTSTWTVVRAYAPNALKLMCLSASGRYIPEHLPYPNEACTQPEEASP